MKSKILGLLAVGLLAGPGAANAVVIVDTGVPFPVEGGGSTGLNRAAQFVTSGAVTVQSIESYFSVTAAGNLAISIYSDDQALPGTSLFSTTIFVSVGDYGWRGVSGLNWLIGPGTYWVATSNLGVSGAATYRTFLGGVTSPMPKEASFNSNAVPPQWQERFADSGWRIQGLVATAVPEPGTLALLGLGLAGLGLSRRRKAT
jgi:hypothetical protein